MKAEHGVFGRWVVMGDVEGIVGTTGNSELHVEVVSRSQNRFFYFKKKKKKKGKETTLSNAYSTRKLLITRWIQSTELL
jgi:hypothetical protein